MVRAGLTAKHPKLKASSCPAAGETLARAESLGIQHVDQPSVLVLKQACNAKRALRESLGKSNIHGF
jgi:hypothetical protein